MDNLAQGMVLPEGFVVGEVIEARVKPGQTYFFIKAAGVEKDIYGNMNRSCQVLQGKMRRPFLDFDKALSQMPKEGEKIILEVVTGQSGLWAKHWCLLADYEAIFDLMPPLYRLRSRTHVFGQGNQASETTWEGRDLSSLLQRYPVMKNWSADILHVGYTGGDISTKYWFEEYIDGQWLECNDPRPAFKKTLPRKRVVNFEEAAPSPRFSRYSPPFQRNLH